MEEADDTYKWEATIGAPADLGLINVDEDAGVAERATAAVARDFALRGPADGLLVDEGDGGLGLGLGGELVLCDCLGR